MTKSMIGIIPAAGSGVRARPYSYEIHKGLFEIDGRSNIARTIDIMRDDLDIEEVVIILGYMGDAIRDTFGDGADFGVSIKYIENSHLDRGWAWSVVLAKHLLAGRHACIMLSDEFYLNTNIGEIKSSVSDDNMVTVAVKREQDESLIKKNFSVERSDDRIIRLVENPVTVNNDILGMATFIVNPKVLTALEEAFDQGRPSIEFVNFIDELIRDGHTVKAFDFEGEYINLNDVASLEAANDMAIRERLNSSK
ncbi:sugar phosphate nucleotidyltransferase [Hirschia maritima]|uniref:sugar phosphate nucleotidyltransferase n=1 Tax=Hirschia maritima TaxID=1121961 RepID=UPI00037AA206|nr:sugar phosphate nucleotidyltransferase [Hirschia maritima]